MHSVLLFSAVLHVAAVGLFVAIALRRWLETRRPKEPSPTEYAAAAAALGIVVYVIVTILAWMGGGFGRALMTGLVAGVLAALSFMLALGAMPHANAGPAGGATFAARMTALAFVGSLVVTELVAFSFLVTVARHA